MLGPSLGLPECRVGGSFLTHGQISYNEDPGSQLAVKLSWSTFLETAVLFCCVLHLSLEAGLSSASTLKMPSEQGSLLCSICVEGLWDCSGINKLLKAACYDLFSFPRNLYRFFAGCCSVIIILRLILTVVLISALLAEFACFIRLRDMDKSGGISLAEVYPFSWVGKLSDCTGDMHSTFPALLITSLCFMKKW